MNTPTPETHGTGPGPSSGSGPLTMVVISSVFAVALVGYVVGLGHPKPVESEGATTLGTSAPPSVERDAIPSVAYSELRERSIGARRKPSPGPVAVPPASFDLFATVDVDADDKRQALAERGALRAYNGAPPTIPHAVDAVSSAACLGCHAEGVAIGDRVARPIPHETFTNCQQCHVAALDVFADAPPFMDSTFEGLPAPFEGERAWPGAPPTIPHSVRLREECVACHGPLGREGLRTTHPWRKNCVQCHAQTSPLDHVAGLAERRTGAAKPSEGPR